MLLLPKPERFALLLFLTAIAACKERSEAQEEAAATAAAPKRLQADGALKVSAQDRAALALEVIPAQEGELPDTALRFGRVAARLGEEAVVVSPVLGRIPTPPLVQRGVAVAADAPLLEVVPLLSAGEHVSLGLQGADLAGQLEATRAELVKLIAAAARVRDLARTGVDSEAKLQEAETAVAAAKARLAALEKGRALHARGEGAGLVLRAPGAGTVVTLEAAVGAVVQPGQVLARILRAGPRWVDIEVLPQEPQGERYEVQAGETWLPAQLLSRGAVVEPDGVRRDRLEVTASATDALLPGATVAVRVGRGSVRGLVLPESALVPGVGGDLVYIEKTPETFVARPVHVAARLGGKVRLRADGALHAGDRVVTQGAMALRGESLRGLLMPEE